MNNYCINHPNKKALSICHICKSYHCEECLIEGNEYYYCHQTHCYNEYLEEKRKLTESYDSNPRFCPGCIIETSDESIGNLNFINFTGKTVTQIYGGVCTVCHSIIVEKEYRLFGMPIKSYGYYRAIKIKKNKTDFAGSKETIFYSRKLLNQKRIEL